MSDDDVDLTGVVLKDDVEAAIKARQLLGQRVAESAVGVGEYASLSCVVRGEQNERVLRIIIAQVVEDPQLPRGKIITFQRA